MCRGRRHTHPRPLYNAMHAMHSDTHAFADIVISSTQSCTGFNLTCLGIRRDTHPARSSHALQPFLPCHAIPSLLLPLIGRHAEPPFPSLRPNSPSPPLRRLTPIISAFLFIHLLFFVSYAEFFFLPPPLLGACFPSFEQDGKTGKSTFAFGHAQLYARRRGWGLGWGWGKG